VATLRSPGQAEAALAQDVAHELNNVGASLYGFLELIDDRTAGDTRLVELRIGVRRIIALAALLESLAETKAQAASCTLSACLLGPASRDPVPGLGLELAVGEITWACDPETRVDADPESIRRAAWTLLEFAALKGGGDRPTIAVSRATAAIDRCGICGAALAVDGLRIATLADSARDLFGKHDVERHRTGVALARLMLRATGHLAHLGGGHLGFDALTGTIAIALRASTGLHGQKSPPSLT